MSAVHSAAGVMVLSSASSGAGERTKVQRGFSAKVTELLIRGMGIVRKVQGDYAASDSGSR